MLLLVWADRHHGAARGSRSDHGREIEFVTSGPCGFSRTPVCAGTLIGALGAGPISGNRALAAGPPGLYIAKIWGRVAIEESAFAEDLSMRYLGYRQRTGGFLPRLSLEAYKEQLGQKDEGVAGRD